MSHNRSLSNYNRGYLTALFSAVIQSTSSVLIRHLNLQYQIPALVMVYWRELFVALMLLVILTLFQRGAMKGIRPHLPFLSVFGVLLASFNATYTISVILNGAAISTALVYVSGAFTAILGWIFLKEKLTSIKIAAILINLAGCALLMEVYKPEAWTVNTSGILIGLLSGLTYAVYTLFGRRSTQQGINSWASLLTAFAIASCIVLILNLAFGGSLPGGAPEPRDMLWLGKAWDGWGYLLLLAAGPTLMGFGSYITALRYLPAGTTNLILTAEPVVTAILAFFLLGEVLSRIQVVGGLLIMTGVILLRIRPGANAE
jgi:drug/metabolite transporter (DMT)-like permease